MRKTFVAIKSYLDIENSLTAWHEDFWVVQLVHLIPSWVIQKKTQLATTRKSIKSQVTTFCVFRWNSPYNFVVFPSWSLFVKFEFTFIIATPIVQPEKMPLRELTADRRIVAIEKIIFGNFRNLSCYQIFKVFLSKCVRVAIEFTTNKKLSFMLQTIFHANENKSEIIRNAINSSQAWFQFSCANQQHETFKSKTFQKTIKNEEKAKKKVFPRTFVFSQSSTRIFFFFHSRLFIHSIRQCFTLHL